MELYVSNGCQAGTYITDGSRWSMGRDLEAAKESARKERETAEAAGRDRARRRNSLDLHIYADILPRGEADGSGVIGGSVGLYHSFIPFTFVGLETMLGYESSYFYKYTDSDDGETKTKYTTEYFYGTFSPVLGFVFGFVNAFGWEVKLFTNAVLEIGNFGSLNGRGLINGWGTPGFDIGINVGIFLDYGGVSLKYRGLILENGFTNILFFGLYSPLGNGGKAARR